MGLYQRIWRLFAGAVIAAGVVLEVITHPLSTLVAIVAVSAAVSVCVGLGMHVGEPETVVPTSTTVSQVMKGALLAIASLTALVGIATVGAMTMLVCAVAVASTSPPAVRKLIGPDAFAVAAAELPEADPSSEGRFTGPAAKSSFGPVDLATSDVRSMGTRQLVRDWRRSFVALEHASDPATKMAVVKARQVLLDELERRDPEGLHDWLESGARAAGDPSKFMSSWGDSESGDPHAA
jgi:hypothetical protein